MSWLRSALVHDIPMVIGLLAAILIAIYIRRQLRLSTSPNGFKKIFIPASALPPSRTARTGDGLLILALGGWIWTHLSITVAELPNLSAIPTDFASLLVLTVTLAAFGVVCAAAIAHLGAPRVAAVFCAIVLIIYSFTLYELWGKGRIAKSYRTSADASSTEADGIYRIEIKNGIRGADIWINDVHLGKTPLEIRAGEFRKRVPPWTEEMAKADGRKVARRLKGNAEPAHPPKYYFRTDTPEFLRAHYASKDDPFNSGLYIQFRLGKAWGYCSGSSGHSGGSQHTSDFRVLFPALERQKAGLLNKARLANYTVGEDWFRAMGSHPDGWNHLRDAAEKEPRLNKLVDEWARWKYDLNSVNDAASAWEVLERIRTEADRDGEYDTASLRGRAIDMLIPYLDAGRLVTIAEKRIRSIRSFGYTHGHKYGRAQFGTKHYRGSFSSGIPQNTPSDMAIAHAIWLLDQRLDEKDDTTENIIERRIATAITCWFPYRTNISVLLGGATLKKHLLRGYKRSLHGDNRYGRWTRMNTPDGQVNGWLYFLAHLRGSEGKAFRSRNESDCLALGRKMIEAANVYNQGRQSKALEFLFLDRDQAQNSLAMKLWPEFHKKGMKVGRDKGARLRSLWAYLIRMEPQPSVKMYVDCWPESAEDFYPHYALRLLKDVPAPKRLVIMHDLLQKEEARSNEIEDRRTANERKGNIRTLRRYIIEAQPALDGKELEQEVFKVISTPRELRWKLHRIAQKPVDHPVYRCLAESEHAEVRAIAVEVLTQRATENNLTLLQTLANDEHESVRKQANKALQDIHKLKSVPPSQFSIVLTDR
jgi:hypothetical protein